VQRTLPDNPFVPANWQLDPEARRRPLLGKQTERTGLHPGSIGEMHGSRSLTGGFSMKHSRIAAQFLFLVFASSPAWAGSNTVAITPLGARTGEFCQVDRALLLEDPTGVRILYDAGRTVAGSTDSRLGDVHVVLLTHVHSDHLGDRRLAQSPDDPSARCDGMLTTDDATPDSNTAEIAARKNSAVIVSADVSTFLNKKIALLLKMDTIPACSGGNEVIVPRTELPCTSNIGFGAKRTLTMGAGQPGVRITAVHAEHGNGLDPSLFMLDPGRASFEQNGLLAPMGPALGYVLEFTNGLSVYLTGDTGQVSDMRTVVRGYYRPKLVVINIGDIFTTGPEEAAFAVNELLEPRAVIPEHANEVATSGGLAIPGTKTARFMELVSSRRRRVYLPLSGHTMEFDSEANCVAGCGPGDVQSRAK
jgi:L-ascorbate metabolism protein UlaG (beta-lactamase superfamily)